MLLKKTTAGIALIAATAALPTTAQEDRYIDIMPFLTRVDSDRNTDRQAAGLRGTFGWQTDENWFTEVQLFGTKLDEDTNSFVPAPVVATPFVYTGDLIPSSDNDLTGLGMDAVYHFNGRRGYSPFLLGGVGVSHNNTKFNYGIQETNAFLNVGAGFTSGAISRSGIKVRAEIRYLYDFFASNMDDWQFGFGLSIPLHQTPAPAPVYVEPPKPVEPPAPVNLDDDGDGVLNQNDRCPDTLPGADVDEYGCVVADQTITLENIQFETNSATLTSSAKTSLNKVVQSLRNQPNTQVEVAGHTDNMGKDDYNLGLSGRRAESVRRYLVERGVNASRISARGYGETQPIASNATNAGRAQNRRVELKFR
ncbi:OmpA family protein [Microbulbifer sp. CAU 1566]|uniref:OmpA family protein n=1 Tax=Microbulbifer sp. CAU 1566 TaxID=2933269 RepID=UPI0020063BAA|nr:OmpA family protein [Microbulbifer sp. CAU 1566]MCK7595713.1 OmpA family protein [Microbulbifer sp. CAU 1566]